MVPHGTIDVLGMICVEEQIMKYLQGYCSQKKSVNFLDKYFSEHMRHGSNLIFLLILTSFIFRPLSVICIQDATFIGHK